ncbi:DUF1707 SHOCT-like domain-containing protein [Propioniciclava flava]
MSPSTKENFTARRTPSASRTGTTSAVMPVAGSPSGVRCQRLNVDAMSAGSPATHSCRDAPPSAAHRGGMLTGCAMPPSWQATATVVLATDSPLSGSNGHLRVGTMQREQALEVLRNAAAEERLTFEELEGRVPRAARDHP